MEMDTKTTATLHREEQQRGQSSRATMEGKHVQILDTERFAIDDPIGHTSNNDASNESKSFHDTSRQLGHLTNYHATQSLWKSENDDDEARCSAQGE